MNGSDIWGFLTSGPVTSVLLTLLNILILLIIVVGIRWILHFVIQGAVNRIVGGAKKKHQRAMKNAAGPVPPIAGMRIVQRAKTLGTVLSNIVNVVLVVVATLLLVDIINPDILASFALLTAAIGAGLGFGAQNIVKDVLNGLFMVIEDQLGVGDIVDLGPAIGLVEDVQIRVTKIRDSNGTLWFVRNGEILRVGNMSQDWSRAIVDVTVPGSVGSAKEAALDAAMALFADDRWRPYLLEAPESWGLQAVESESSVIRVAIRTHTAAHADVSRELRERISAGLETAGVSVTGVSSVTVTGFEDVTYVKRHSHESSRDG